MRTFIYRPLAKAEGYGRKLATAADVKCISNLLPPRAGQQGLIFNYGCNKKPDWFDTRGQQYWWFNPPWRVKYSSDKLLNLRTLREAGVPTIDWTESRDEAQRWLDEGATVYARTLLRASKAKGLVIVQPGGELPDAPLYTKEFRKSYEYRVHVAYFPCGDEPEDREPRILLTTQKRARNGTDADLKVRNLVNGWVFCVNKVDPLTPEAERTCMRALEALDLDFVGVDLLVKKDGTAVICETNTAPAFGGKTVLNAYTQWMRSWAERYRNSVEGLR